MKDGISIIVPIYNTNIKYLNECITSILNQSYRNIEVILLNDGSTESYIKNVLEDYAKKDTRIKVVNKDNSGVSSTRNLGIGIAKNEWIMFVDADDYLIPNACESLIERLNADVDIVISKNYNVNSNNEVSEINNGCHSNKTISTEDEKIELINSIFYEHNTMYHYVDTPWAKLYRREFIIDNDIKFKEDLKMAEDGLFNFEAFLLAKKIAYLHLPTYYYRKNDESVCNKCNYFVIDNYKKVFDYYEEQFSKYSAIDFYDAYNYFVYRQVRNIMERYIFNKQNKKSKKALKVEMKEFLNYSVCKNAFSNVKTNEINKKNKIILFVMKSKKYFLIRSLFKIKEIL